MPKLAHAYHGWGRALSILGKHSKDAEAANYYKMAGRKFQAYLNLEPTSDIALNSLSTSYRAESYWRTERSALRLLDMSIKLLMQSLKHDPNNAMTLSSLGNSYLEKSKLTIVKNRDTLLKQTILKLTKAGYPADYYNLACVFVAQRNYRQAKVWLGKALINNFLPPVHAVVQDPDFASVKTRKWFEKFVSRAEVDFKSGKYQPNDNYLITPRTWSI